MLVPGNHHMVELLGQRDELLRLIESAFPVTIHVLVDSQAGHAICSECHDLGVDLVVMATHGRGGLRRTLLGSTADKVIRSAHTPVLVRRPPDAG